VLLCLWQPSWHLFRQCLLCRSLAVHGFLRRMMIRIQFITGLAGWDLMDNAQDDAVCSSARRLTNVPVVVGCSPHACCLTLAGCVAGHFACLAERQSGTNCQEVVPICCMAVISTGTSATTPLGLGSWRDVPWSVWPCAGHAYMAYMQLL